MKQLTISLAASILGLGTAMAQPLELPTQTIQEVVESAPDSKWIGIEPENLLVMELPSGPMIIELRPDLAPRHVERIKLLTREGFYNGLTFHRVIEGFMAQGGDPLGNGQGGSDYPDIPGEFAHDASVITNHTVIGRDDRAAQIGFLGTVPVATQAPTLPKILSRQVYALWGIHCQGVLSMARANNPNSANSQFFVMFGDARDNLDQGYTVWGKVVDGFHNARRINRGEPPVRPTPIVRVRVMSDLPAEEQKTVEYLDPSSETFKTYLTRTRKLNEEGFVTDACSIDVPVRINGELKL